MEYTANELEAKLDQLARIIDERADGERYVVLFERVESELEAVRARESKLDKIRRRGRGTRAPSIAA